MPNMINKMPKFPVPKSAKRVVALLYPNLCLFEFSCVAEVFGLDRPELGHIYDFATVAIDDRTVKTQFGGTLQPSITLDEITGKDTLVIPGWCALHEKVNATLIAFLIKFNTSGGRIVTICSGAYPVACSGLLDGRALSTHWRYAAFFEEHFPAISICADKLYVDCGDVITSAGSAAGLDVCLHVIRKDYGSKIANIVARRLVIPPQREGNQAQFIDMPITVKKSNVIAPLLDYLSKNIHLTHTIAEMAQTTNMSERSFIRKFKSATGLPPKAWIIGQRMSLALQLLEENELNIEAVAEQLGFESTTAFRHHFREKFKTTPSSFREKFQLRSP
jgi:AraC family transcriptional regulator, transcriptional activator FtrA